MQGKFTRQFRFVDGGWSEHDGCYSGEMSTLRIDRVPSEFILTLPGQAALFFVHTATDRDGSGDDVYGWRFSEPGGKTALIIND